MRKKITTEFVAELAGVNPLTVRYCIQNNIYPYSDFAQAFTMPGCKRTQYAISPEQLKEHFYYTDQELQAFYAKKK